MTTKAYKGHIVREPENIFLKGDWYPLYQRRHSESQGKGYCRSAKSEEGTCLPW